MACVGELILYICFGFETGESDTVHLQGYLQCSRQSRFAAIHKETEVARLSLQAARGTLEENQAYTAKDGEWFEYGTPKATRAKQSENLLQNRLITLKKTIQTGATEDEIFDLDPVISVRHEKWVQRQMLRVKPKRLNDLVVYLFIGKPGTGKTRLAKHIFPDIYDPPIGKDLWFDLYEREKQVLIDDFSGNIRLVDALRLFDLNPIKVPIKHGFQWFAPEIIIITSNVHPRHWWNYADREDSAQAIHRRIKHVWDFDNILNGRPQILKPDEYWALPIEPPRPQINYDLFQVGTMQPPLAQAILDDIDQQIEQEELEQEEIETISDEQEFDLAPGWAQRLTALMADAESSEEHSMIL